jgi:hypothetical protein
MRKLSLAVMLFLLAACSSMNLGDTLGGILGSSGANDPSDLHGVVTVVDTSAQRIDLNVDTINNLRESVSNTSIYYDSQSVVRYNGQDYRPTDLERGDEITVRGSNRNGRYVADTITVTRNARS